MHVGLVLPGFISTEGFPQAELTAKPWTRWIVSTPEKAAEAIYEAGLGRRAERYVPRPYALAAALRVLAPALVRRALGGGAARVMTTTTGADLAERRNGAEATSAELPRAHVCIRACASSIDRSATGQQTPAGGPRRRTSISGGCAQSSSCPA